MRKTLWTLPTLLAVVAGIILVEKAGLRAGRLIECLALLALCVHAAWAFGGRMANSFLIACSLLFGLAVIQGVLLVVTTKSASTTRTDSTWIGPRPVLGWGPVRPGTFRVIRTGSDGRIIFDTSVTIDAALNRKTVPAGPRPIAFFGDSWTYGDGVNDPDTLPQAFADLNGRKIPVLNLAFGGWSPAQNLAALRTGLYDRLLGTPRHIVLLAATFQVDRVACKADFALTGAPRFVVEGDAVVQVGTCADALWPGGKALLDIANSLGLYRALTPQLHTLTHADVDRFIKVVAAFAAEAKRKYRLDATVLYVPFDQRYIAGTGYTDEDIVAALRRSGVDVLEDELPDIPDTRLYWIQGDGHPTALAYRARAKEVEDHIRRVDPAALTP